MKTITKNAIKAFPIIAKSNPEMLLKDHINDCLNIFEQLKICVPNLPIDDKTLFWSLLRVSVIFHDMGKSHADFQKLLRGIPNLWHSQRHELFSLFFVNDLNYSLEQKEMLLFAIFGHHKSLFELFSFVAKNYKFDCSEEGNDLSFDAECQKMNVDQIWKLALEYGLERGLHSNLDLYKLLKNECKIKLSPIDSSFYYKLLLVGAMKQCDHLASAGVKHLEKLELKDFNFLFQHTLYTHQQEASSAIGNVILSAPTGSGKTETSFLWLKKQIEERGQGRTFYILPYTASINAMYERLNKDISDNEVVKVGMVHGKLAQYLENKMSSELSMTSEHLAESFKTMVTPVKITTPFQLLKHLFGIKGFEKGLFEWSGGYFIFDEIHAYDAIIFAQIIILLEFAVKYLKVQVHIMTATLPSFLKIELGKAIGEHRIIVASEKLYDDFVRHRVELLDGLLCDSLGEIQKSINCGKTVLVVCNTVEQSQFVFKQLRSDCKVLLHGSFNAEDRFAKEQLLMSEKINLLVGTQAIEVSLDIDFDMIYTEPAPFDAIIQRFGRVNRKRKKGISPCYVFKERNRKDLFIYKDADVIERTLKALEKIIQEDNGIIKEKRLQSVIDYVYPNWNLDAKNEYEDTKTYLSYSVMHELTPLVYDEKKEEDYYKRFDGMKVLPISLLEKYSNWIIQYQFIKAEGLLVSVSSDRFLGMLKRRDIEKRTVLYDSQSEDQVRDKTVYVIKRKYNAELGLLLKELDFDNTDNFFL